MEKIIAVSVDPWETQVAILADGLLDEYHLGRTEEKRIVGNIYKGRVASVLSGIQAAFVDVGTDKNGFLYVAELPQLPSSVEEDKEGPKKKSFFGRRRREPHSGIELRLKKGDEVLVQVSKDAIAKKGCRLTTHLSLPGRFLVLMPHIGKVGVSKRIPNATERRRLRDIARSIAPRKTGLIVRTAGAGISKQDLKEDLKYLMDLWKSIQKEAKSANAPKLLHKDLDLKSRVIRDFLTKDISKVIVEDEEAHAELLSFAESIAPSLASRIQKHGGQERLFETLGISDQLDKVLLKKASLKSGGTVIIEQTEALTSVDVNSGSSVERKNLEDTALQTNMEAADEICRQIRLRNLGGIIIIDFIDMVLKENKQKLLKHLYRAARRDKAPFNITEISDLGLVEMTRKRDKRSLQNQLYSTCPYCSGTAKVKSLSTMAIEIQRRIRSILRTGKGKEILVKAHPDVASHVLNKEKSSLLKLEKSYGAVLVISPEESFHREEAKFYSVDSMQLIESIKTAKPMPKRNRKQSNKRRYSKGGRGPSQRRKPRKYSGKDNRQNNPGAKT